MRLTQKQGALITIATQIAGIGLSVIALLFSTKQTTLPLNLGFLTLYILLFLASYRGWRFAQQATVIAVTLVTALTTTLSTGFNVQALLPAAVATVMASPPWVLGSALATWFIILARPTPDGGPNPYSNPQSATFFLIIVVIMIVARVVTETALRRAEDNARAAQTEREQSQLQAHELSEANRRLGEELSRQKTLLDLVATLEIPSIQMAEGVIFVPIVGYLDSQRAERLLRRSLEEAYSQRASLFVLDIIGVSVIDTSVAQALIRTATALRLLGCTVCISGVSPTVATTLVSLCVPFQDIVIVRNPQEALAYRAEHTRREARALSPQGVLAMG